MQDKIMARDLLAFSPETIQDHLPVKFVLVFDDGEMITTRRRTKYSSFYWCYHKEFPKTPLLQRHHVEHTKKGKPTNAGTHTELLEAIIRDVYAHYEDDVENLADITSRMATRATNDMTNNMSLVMGPYVTPIDLLDGIIVTRHPQILELVRGSVPDARYVEKIYDTVTDVLLNDPEIRTNGLSFAARSKTVKMEQVLQSVSILGFRTEVDGKIFDVPVNAGYVEGITRIGDFASDSRSAPKAQTSTEDPLKDSAYLSRRLEFLASVVERIEGKDCGANYVEWYVTPEIRDEANRLVVEGGIRSMVGKYIEHPETKERIEVKGNENYLNGTYVRMRSVVNCKNKNPHTVCRTCFGGLWRNLYRHANLGHLCCVTMTEKIIQGTLGLKHSLASGEGAPIRLTAFTSRFFSLTQKKTSYVFQPILKKMGLKITLARNEAIRLVEVMKMDDISDLRVGDVTRLSNINIHYKEKGKNVSDLVPINQGNRIAFATLELIKYIREHKWETDDNNNFLIDMKDWDFTKPAFSIPQMEISLSEHGAEVGKMIESNMNNINERLKPESPLKTLQELSELVASKLEIPLSCLEVIVYASMIPAKNNHAMARNWENAVLGIARTIIYSRSLSCAYAFQGHVDFMLDPKSFFPHFRPDNPMDVFFSPKKVIEHYKSIGRA